MGRREALLGLAAVAAASLGCSGDGSEEAASGLMPRAGSVASPGASPSEGASPSTEVSGRVPAFAQAPTWEEVPACVASPTDGAGQGPFFIHEGERSDDVSLVRQDIRGRYDQAAEPGVDMELHVRVLDAGASDCVGAPLEGIEIYVWHTDAQGYYSGFGEPGEQRPDEPYAGAPNQNDLDSSERFCRGLQVTGADGVVSFRSIFPGWYNGRDIHVHLLAMRRGSVSRGREVYAGGDHLFTTQFYFDRDLTDAVHRSAEPYRRRTALSAYEGAIRVDEPGNSGIIARARLEGSVVIAQVQILLPTV